MGPFAHIFLPLTAAYAIRPDLFENRAVILLASLGLVADADKFVGVPGLFHSLVVIIPCCVVILAIGRSFGWWSHAVLSVGFISSHLLLDAVDGGPVPLLFPLVRSGIGFRYPARIAFGQGPLGIAIDGPLVVLHSSAPRPGFNSYGLIDGTDVASILLFVTVYLGVRRYRD